MMKYLRTATKMEKGLCLILVPVHSSHPWLSASTACRPGVRQYIAVKVMAARKQRKQRLLPVLFKPIYNPFPQTRPYLLKPPATSTILQDPLVLGLWGEFKTPTKMTTGISSSQMSYEYQNTLVRGVVWGKTQWLFVFTHDIPRRREPLETAMPAQR